MEHSAIKLSVFVTTYNNARTLERCLSSVAWADEIIVLDSFSDDDTVTIANRFGCRIHQHEFLGYGPQKQMALEKTSNDWVLLLDADEFLSDPLQAEIRALLGKAPDAHGYEVPRREQVFWRMSRPGVRWNHYLRLFDKHRGHISDMPVHAAPKVTGTIKRLRHPFLHLGETDIHTKVGKINAYSSGLVEHRIATGKQGNPFLLVVYPPLFFLRSYIFKREFLNGWAGFISSVVGAFYVFLKNAKVYERRQRQQVGAGDVPSGTNPGSGDQNITSETDRP